LIEKNLRRANLNNDLIVVTDGAQAVDYVFRRGNYQERDQTQALLILLDLNLPVLDGYEVLQRIKSDEQIKKLRARLRHTKRSRKEAS
jgi:CheY-like chemotaxis protein